METTKVVTMIWLLIITENKVNDIKVTLWLIKFCFINLHLTYYKWEIIGFMLSNIVDKCIFKNMHPNHIKYKGDEHLFTLGTWMNGCGMTGNIISPVEEKEFTRFYTTQSIYLQ